MNFDMKSIASRMMNSTFVKVENVVWSLTTGNIGIASTDKSVKNLSFTKGEDGSLEQFRITESLFEIFGMPIPAFATRASIADIHPSNMVIVSGKVYWVISKAGSLLKVLNPDGMVTELACTELTGLNGGSSDEPSFMLVKPLIDMFGGSKKGMKGFSSELMPMIAMSQMGGGNSGFDLEKMIPLMLLGGGLGGKKKGGGGMMQNLMMMQMFSGKEGFKLPF